jgi:hypothetical protein
MSRMAVIFKQIYIISSQQSSSVWNILLLHSLESKQYPALYAIYLKEVFLSQQTYKGYHDRIPNIIVSSVKTLAVIKQKIYTYRNIQSIFIMGEIVRMTIEMNRNIVVYSLVLTIKDSCHQPAITSRLILVLESGSWFQ